MQPVQPVLFNVEMGENMQQNNVMMATLLEVMGEVEFVLLKIIMLALEAPPQHLIHVRFVLVEQLPMLLKVLEQQIEEMASEILLKNEMMEIQPMEMDVAQPVSLSTFTYALEGQ